MSNTNYEYDLGVDVLICSLPKERFAPVGQNPALFVIADRVMQLTVVADEVALRVITPLAGDQDEDAAAIDAEIKLSQWESRLIKQPFPKLGKVIELDPEFGTEGSVRAVPVSFGKKEPEASEPKAGEPVDEREYFLGVLKVLEENPNIHPFFTPEFSRGIMRASFDYNLTLPPEAATRDEELQLSNHVIRGALGHGYRMNDLLEIKELVAPYREDFLAAISEFQMSAPRDLSLAELARKLVGLQVGPSMRAIGNTIDANTVRRAIGDEYGGNPRPAIELVGGVAIAMATDLPILASITGLSVLTLANVAHALWQRSRTQESIENDPWFLVYKVASYSSSRSVN